jgi:hypothetical protein
VSVIDHFMPPTAIRWYLAISDTRRTSAATVSNVLQRFLGSTERRLGRKESTRSGTGVAVRAGFARYSSPGDQQYRPATP